MENYQNQYGAVPETSSKDPIQMEMEATGDMTGIGGSTQVIAEEYDHKTTTGDSDNSDSDNSGVVGETNNVVVEGNDQKHHKKKGIIEKIKEKLPGTHHHN
ncbi:hypothetical protein TanjilG_31555 [Lupinus angustifolius]|uniref:Dehydrin n=1 Tax=Lupinus angustifolius TaxID=3871 RepID=A0A1J7H175_LUPAN|nr:PREDICTED: dehydrin Xero 1-like [Lupinus angustifolius]OIV94130.1 hypothetical protein TanjilG_31555 [Lupinus angustifolius]